METLFDDECFSEIETKPLVNIQEGLYAAATDELHRPSVPTSAADNNNQELLEANGKLMAKSMVLRAKTAQLKLHQTQKALENRPRCVILHWCPIGEDF